MHSRVSWILGALVVPAVLAAAPTGLHLLGEVKIGGDGGWDYLTVDPVARRLYVSHATHVAVVDIDALKVVGDIPNTPGVHGIAIAPTLNRGFISNGRSNNVTIFDLRTLAPLGQVATGENPDSIRYDAVSGRVFTFNGRSKNSTAIDAKTGSVAATIALPGKPEFAVADGKGKVYVNIEDTSEVVEIDATKATVTKKYSLAPCQEPSGLAIDVVNRKLFSVCANRLMTVSDPDSGRVVATPPIGAGSDGVAFDPGNGYAVSSNGDGTLTVVHENGGKWEVVENIATERGARTIAVDEKTHRIFAPTAKSAPAAAGARSTYLPDSFRVLVIGK